MTVTAFANNDSDLACNIEPLEQVVDNLKSTLRDHHIVRLKDGACTVEVGFIWADILTNLERASDHCSNIAACILDANQHNMNVHESVRSMKENDQNFDAKFKEYTEKYTIEY